MSSLRFGFWRNGPWQKVQQSIRDLRSRRLFCTMCGDSACEQRGTRTYWFSFDLAGLFSGQNLTAVRASNTDPALTISILIKQEAVLSKGCNDRKCQRHTMCVSLPLHFCPIASLWSQLPVKMFIRPFILKDSVISTVMGALCVKSICACMGIRVHDTKRSCRSSISLRSYTFSVIPVLTNTCLHVR